jgi:DNA-binding CsgD family transcriptional regulator
MLVSQAAICAFWHNGSDHVLGAASVNLRVLDALGRAISGTGSNDHVERLVDLIAALVPHDLVTVVRYSVTQRPEFLSHRNFSNEMVRKYLELYYPHDPFYRYWRTHRRPGVVPLKRLAGPDVKRGRYIAEFLSQSVITDEVGVLLEDGPGWCLGIFLDRSVHKFRPSEVARLEIRFPIFAALHALDLKTRRPGFMRTDQPTALAHAPERGIPKGLWPELSSREKQLVELILAGFPTAVISKRLGITVGTVKNHRRRIYEKLDITTERELFLQYFEPRATPET